ncbi:MAG: DegT/DnrJ/EryC1/StrS family aminotransferase [Bacteroidota bacterium]
MTNIQMVDLSGQYQKIKPEVDAAIQGVIDSSQFINGDEVKKFASELSEYLSGAHVIPCANGTDALQIALMALNLHPGDEIIVPAFTFISPVEVVALLGLTPVFVDVDPETFLMIPEQVEKAITSKTKAIIPVHLYGQCADMEALTDIAERHNIPIIEDTAQAIGTDCQIGNKTRKAGTIGHIGCTSFFPSKNLGCFGDGGALFTRDETLFNTMKSIANHGSKKKYYNDMIGVNSRLDTIQAAVLRVKLKYLDNYNDARRNSAAAYDERLRDINGMTIPKRVAYSSHTFHQYTIRVKNDQRDILKAYLESINIPAMIYYPVPLHLQKAFTNNSKKPYKLQNSEQLCTEVLSLPMHTELAGGQIDFITENIKKFFKQ